MHCSGTTCVLNGCQPELLTRIDYWVFAGWQDIHMVQKSWVCNSCQDVFFGGGSLGSGLVHVPLVVKPSSKQELFCWLVAPEILTFLHCAFSKARRVLLLSTFTQTNQLAAIGLCQMSVKVMFLRKKSEGEQNVRKPYRLYISYTLLLRRTACSNRAVSVNDGNVSQSNLPYSFTGKKSEAEQNVRKHAIKTISTVHFLHSQCVSYSWWQNNMICSKVPKTRK